VNFRINGVTGQNVDPEKLGHELGLIKPFVKSCDGLAIRKGDRNARGPLLVCVVCLLYGFQVTWIVIFASAVSVTHANAPEQTVALRRSDLVDRGQIAVETLHGHSNFHVF
jgi:hypothetical protein